MHNFNIMCGIIIEKEIKPMSHAVHFTNYSPANPSDASFHPPAVEEKTKRAAKSIFYKAAIGVLAGSLFVATFGGTLGARLISHYSHKSLKDDIEQAHIKSVSESLRIVLTGPNRGKRTSKPQELSFAKLKEDLLLSFKKEKGIDAGPETKREAAILAGKVLNIREQIKRLERGEYRIEDLHSALSDAMNHSLYQTIKRQDSEAVNFLQFVAIKLLAADGTNALKNYGKKCLGDLKGNAFSPDQLADGMARYLAKPGFSYGAGWPIWAACHPFSVMHAAKSEYNPLGYDGAEGNPNFSAHAFCIGDKKMIFYYGPGPTGNPIFEHGVLPAYEKFGVFELRFNHQDAMSKHEYVRIQEIQRITDENPGVLRHALLGFDTKMKNNKGVEFDDSDQFFACYRDYVKNGVRGHHSRKNHSGFHIPKSLLSDEGVDTALNMAQEFCKIMSENNPYWKKAMTEKSKTGILETLRYHGHSTIGNQKELYALANPGKARMAKMMQLIADTFLTLAMLYRSFDAITPEMAKKSLDERLDKDLTALRTSGACKQDVDRAVIENISLRLFFRWTHNLAPLTRDEVYEIAGAVLGRARLVDDRKIIEKRYKILDDLLRFIGSAPKGVTTAHSLLKDYSKALMKKA
jgi:hypothetical protein